MDGVAEGIEDRGDVRSIPGQCFQTFVIGSAMYSAKAPGRCTPMPVRVRAEVAAAGHAVAAAAADDMALAADDVAHREVADVRTHLDDLTHELVADRDRHGDRRLRPRVPAVDVEIGAADTRLAHADDDVVDPVLRLRDVLEPEPGAGVGLDERLHACSVRPARAERGPR